MSVVMSGNAVRMGSPAAPTSSARTSLALLDPGLFFDGGHNASFARLVVAEMRRRGLPVAVHGAKRIDRPPVGLRIERSFGTSAYAPVSSDAPDRELRRHNDRTLEDLNALPASVTGDESLVLLPSLTSRLVLAAARWAAAIPASSRVRVAMVLMFQPGWAGDEALRRAELAIYTEAMRILRDLPPTRVSLFAETRPIGDVFERLGAPRVETIAWPVTLDTTPDERFPYDPMRTAPHVAHLGYTKLDRGFGLLPDIIEASRQSRPDLRFTVQANYWDPASFAEHASRMEAMDAVRLLRGPLDPPRFARELSEADVVLLPYSAKGYRDRGSGVFVEAASAGRVLVLPAGTWMAQHARDCGLAAVEFDRFEAPSVTEALLEAVENRRALLARGAEAAEGWNGLHSPGGFMDRVFAEPDPDEPVRLSIAGTERDSVAEAKPASAADDTEYMHDGMWTPQTQMLRRVRDWILGCPDELIGDASAAPSCLSVDRNPTLSDMVRRRWGGAEIEEARYPEHDVQDLGVFADDTFDLTFSHQVLEHVPKPWKAAAELVRVTRPGGVGVHTTCASNPLHGPPAFNDYYRFLPDGLEQLFDGVEVLVKASWGNRQALAYNHAIDDGHGALGGRRFHRALGEPNEEQFPWHTWIIFRKR